MGKKAKGSRNGFFYFMSEMRTNLRLATMQEASIIADPIWKTMPMGERKVYDEKAARYNNKARAKMTATHENLEHLMRAEENKARREKEMKEEIETLVHTLADEKRLVTEDFYVMHWNSFGYIQQHRRHYPAEVAIARFNVRDGVDIDNVFHRIVNPGKMPLGYAYTAKSVSGSSHQLPPPIDDSEINLEEVIVAVYSFLDQDNKGSKKFPPIFVKDKDMAQVEGILHQLCFDFDFDTEMFKIYSLQHFLFCLVNSMDRGGVPVWPTINQSVGELEQDAYDYTLGISCTYHEECDVTVYCSRSIVIRSVYIICGNCCRILDLPMVCGRHIPVKSDDDDDDDSSPTQREVRVVPRESSPLSGASKVSLFDNFKQNVPRRQVENDSGWIEVTKKKSAKSASSSSSAEPCPVSNDPAREPSTSTASARTINRPLDKGAIPKIGRGRGRNVRH